MAKAKILEDILKAKKDAAINEARREDSDQTLARLILQVFSDKELEETIVVCNFGDRDTIKPSCVTNTQAYVNAIQGRRNKLVLIAPANVTELLTEEGFTPLDEAERERCIGYRHNIPEASSAFVIDFNKNNQYNTFVRMLLRLGAEQIVAKVQADVKAEEEEYRQRVNSIKDESTASIKSLDKYAATLGVSAKADIVAAHKSIKAAVGNTEVGG